jgi:hypothetical protein
MTTGGIQAPGKTDRPEPNALHVASGEAKEKERQAINYVMARDNISYPDAKKIVLRDGAEKLLSAREGTDKEAHARNVESLALANRLKIPGENAKFLLELNDRVAALEAAAKPATSEPAA